MVNPFQDRLVVMNEFWRKIVHMVFGLLITLLIYYVPKESSLIILGVGLLVGLWFIDLEMRKIRVPLIHELILHLERPGVFPGKGAFYFVFTALITLILFPSDVAVQGILILSVLDGMATIIGLRYGRIRIINHKSIEGSGGAIIVTFIVLLFFMDPVRAAVLSVVAGIVELGSPIDDNLLLPIIIDLLIVMLPW